MKPLLAIGPRYVKQDASGLRPFVPPEPVEGQRQALEHFKRLKLVKLSNPFDALLNFVWVDKLRFFL